MVAHLTCIALALYLSPTQVVDASEQLTRAGIDLLKSGFSRFGFGASGSRMSGASGTQQQLAASSVIVIFVVGGITFEEV